MNLGGTHSVYNTDPKQIRTGEQKFSRIAISVSSSLVDTPDFGETQL